MKDIVFLTQRPTRYIHFLRELTQRSRCNVKVFVYGGRESNWKPDHEGMQVLKKKQLPGVDAFIYDEKEVADLYKEENVVVFANPEYKDEECFYFIANRKQDEGKIIYFVEYLDTCEMLVKEDFCTDRIICCRRWKHNLEDRMTSCCYDEEQYQKIIDMIS